MRFFPKRLRVKKQKTSSNPAVQQQQQQQQRAAPQSAAAPIPPSGGAPQSDPTENQLLSTSYDDTHLLDRTDVKLLAVEDDFHAQLDRKGGGGSFRHNGGGGYYSNEEKKDNGSLMATTSGRAPTTSMSTPSPRRPFSRITRGVSDAANSGTSGGGGSINTNDRQRKLSEDSATPLAGEKYTSQMELILSAGRRSGGKSGGGPRNRSMTSHASGGSGGGGLGLGGVGLGASATTSSSRPTLGVRLDGKERSKRFAEERKLKMDFQSGDAELGHPVVVPPLPSDGDGIPRNISVSSNLSVDGSVSTTGLDGPSAPTFLMQNPEHRALPLPAQAQVAETVPTAVEAGGAGRMGIVARGRSTGTTGTASSARTPATAASGGKVSVQTDGSSSALSSPITSSLAAANAAAATERTGPRSEGAVAGLMVSIMAEPGSANAPTSIPTESADMEVHYDSSSDIVPDLPFQRNRSFSPSGAVNELSTRSAPVFANDNANLALRRNTSVATAATTTTRSDIEEIDYEVFEDVTSSNRTDSGALCKVRRINLLIDQVESALFPFKKKLILANMNLTASELPVDDICTPEMCHNMNKLSLSGNRLGHVPERIVLELTGLRTLDLSQCDLRSLPPNWNLPFLKRLDLSHNRLVDFPDESVLRGMPELQHLDLYGNKVSEITLPEDCKVLVKLDHLNMGYNNLQALPDDITILTNLRTLKIMNNIIEKIPQEVCDMDLRVIDCSSNPLIQPPVETCDRGIFSMRRYYHCLKLDEKSRQRMLDAIHMKSEAKREGRDRSKSKASLKKKQKEFCSVLGLGKKDTRFEDDESQPHQSRFSEFSPGSPPTSLTEDKRQLSAPPEATGLARSAPSHGFLSHGPLLTPLSEGGPALRSKTVGAVSSDGGLLTPSSKAAEDVGKSRHNKSKLIDKKHEDVELKPGKESLMTLERTESQDLAEELALAAELDKMPADSINDTLKVIFVGMAMAGKTSIIKRLLEGKNAVIPKREERTVGVDIYNWEPKKDGNTDRGHIDTSIKIEDDVLERTSGDVDVKFSLWDFAGQHVYHATHELFFSQRALYILVWDLGITNNETHKRRRRSEVSQGAFKLSYDSSDDEEEEEDDEAKRADRALERDIDEKVQFWVECIQSSAPGAAILPVASFDDYFDEEIGWGKDEANRRCAVMRDRLIKHEDKRVQGLRDRLEAYERDHRANSEAALRLRKLLCPFCRPKLVFGSDGGVVRVSGAKYTGFDRLSEKLVNIATGRDHAGWEYPIFRGHVGARIPRMRLEVRDVVREMRDKFKVVEWNYFIRVLREKGLHNVEDVSDALHFLTNIGELSYFGDVIKGFGSSRRGRGSDGDDADDNGVIKCPDPGGRRALSIDDEDYEDDDAFVYPLDRLASDQVAEEERSVSATASMSTSSLESLASGLSQFIFLNPRWLVAAVACILRHDLNREINETRRVFNKKKLVSWDSSTLNGEDFSGAAHLNCPVVTAEDACLLWQAKKIINKAAERALQYSNNMTMSPFDFLQRLLIRFRVFVPIDLDIEKAVLGGREFGPRGEAIEVDEGSTHELNAMTEDDARFFFLPSLLGPGEPGEVWSYKNSDSWKTTICHSILFPDGVPPGLMERITATVLSDIYAATQTMKQGQSAKQSSQTEIAQQIAPDARALHLHSNAPAFDIGQLVVKEILCWRSSFYLKLGMEVTNPADGQLKESVVEIFCALLDKDSHLCVSSDYIGVGMRRLVLSGKGQVGEGGRKIWKGGYTLVIRAIGRVMEEYGGLEFEKQAICPECLAKRPVSRASLWDWSLIRSAARNGDETMRCQIGHRVDTRLITGIAFSQPRSRQMGLTREKSDKRLADHIVPVTDLLRGVVVVGLWDGKTDTVVRVGSGFVVDKKRGLIVTASHTLMNIWGDGSSPFGENYYGLRRGKVVIGVIPREQGSDSIDSTTAVFRYFATIVAKDENIDANGFCHMDACVLRITTRLEQDVGGNGGGCADQPEILLVGTEAFKKERLHQLKVSHLEAELDEQVRILGYNQGGEGLVRKGMSVNRVADFARGYLCMIFNAGVEEGYAMSRRFKPKEEIVVMCPTIGGHSGGPCVNQSGEVIGILSRADPSDRQRCYLVPAKAWKGLVKQAKHQTQYI